MLTAGTDWSNFFSDAKKIIVPMFASAIPHGSHGVEQEFPFRMGGTVCQEETPR